MSTKILKYIEIAWELLVFAEGLLFRVHERRNKTAKCSHLDVVSSEAVIQAWEQNGNSMRAVVHFSWKMENKMTIANTAALNKNEELRDSEETQKMRKTQPELGEDPFVREVSQTI